MALVWITEVANRTEYPLLLRQTDPSRNPVIDEVKSGGWIDGIAGETKTGWGKPKVHEWFTICPNSVLKTSWFIVPWANSGGWINMILNNHPDGKPNKEKDGIQFYVAPDGGGATDYLQFFDRNLNPIVGNDHTALENGVQATIAVGGAGAAASTSGRLNVTDRSITYQITESNSAGSDTIAALKGVGEAIAIAAAVVAAGAGVAAIPKPIP
jgi:hypothetical protein